METEKTPEETYYEPFLPSKEDGNESIFLNAEKTIKITVTDGDYTLREGIDYRAVYVRGHGDASYSTLMVAGGMGKYKNLFFQGVEYRVLPELIPPEREENVEQIMQLYYLAHREQEQENDGSS